ncbi:PaaX family transcriptional regulator C-terminal domain-containing protein [soil metagenome]
MRARSALFTLFGDVVRPAGGQAWLSTLTGCMNALGFTPEATRTALHRMSAEGWVEHGKVGRYATYRLTPRGVDRLEEAAARIYRLRAVEWDRRWRLLMCAAAGRRPELAKALTWMGFGRLSSDTWVSPHPHGDRLATLLAEHDQPDALRFVTDARHADGDHDRRIVTQAWDFDVLHTAHADFCARWGRILVPGEPAAAFTTRIELVHHWRSFLFLDPGLPVSLLPVDWRGDEAARLFRSLYEAVEAPAWAFHDALATAAPAAGDPAPTRDPAASPFARGLAALETARRDPHRELGVPRVPEKETA